jgi:hypothetical protein
MLRHALASLHHQPSIRISVFKEVSRSRLAITVDSAITLRDQLKLHRSDIDLLYSAKNLLLLLRDISNTLVMLSTLLHH